MNLFEFIVLKYLFWAIESVTVIRCRLLYVFSTYYEMNEFNFSVYCVGDRVCMLCSSPATCRGCTVVCWLCCRCTALDNSLLHRTVHMCLGLPPLVQDPQCAKPEHKREQTFVCCGVVTMPNFWVQVLFYFIRPEHVLRRHPPSAPEQPALAEREAPWRQTSPDPL